MRVRLLLTAAAIPWALVGAALREQGRFRPALLVQRCVLTWVRLVDNGGLATDAALNGVGLSLKSLGRFEAAEDAYLLTLGIVVANNGAWQIEVDDQQTTYGRVVGTRLQFSDYAAMARAFGMHAERVERSEDLDAALDRALANRPALLDVVVTPEAASSDARSGLARPTRRRPDNRRNSGTDKKTNGRD